jgi:hypothetical protein
MGVTYHWDDDKHTIMIAEYAGMWTLEDYYDSYDAMVAELNALDHPAVIICDFAQSGTPPAKLFSTRRYTENNDSHNFERLIMVNPGTFLSALMKVSIRFMPRFGQKLMVATDMDDARARAADLLAEARDRDMR